MKPCIEPGSIPFLSAHSSVLSNWRSSWITWWSSVQTGSTASSRADSSPRRSTRKISALPGTRSCGRPSVHQAASKGSPGGARSASPGCHLMRWSKFSFPKALWASSSQDPALRGTRCSSVGKGVWAGVGSGGRIRGEAGSGGCQSS